MMAIFITWLAILAAGFGIATFLFAGAVTWLEFAAIAWLLGSAAVSLLLPITSLIGSALWNLALSSLAIAIMAYLGSQRFRNRKLHLVWRPPQGATEMTLCAQIGILVALELFRLNHQTLGWDGLLVWEFKARLAFENGGVPPLAYFTDANRVWTHPAYPLFIPMLETWLYQVSGNPNQAAIPWLLAPFLPAALVVSGSLAKKLSGSRVCGLGTAVLLLCVPYPWTGIGSLGSGYSDFPLALFYLAAVASLIGLPQPNAALFALLSTSLPWVKREGVILWGTLVLLLLFKPETRTRKWLFSVLPGLTLMLIWRMAMRHMHVPADDDFAPFSLPAISQNFSRSGEVLYRVLEEFRNVQHWSFLWLGFAVILLIWFRRTPRLFAAVLIPLTFNVAVLFLSKPEHLASHVDSAFARLVLHSSFLALTTTAGLGFRTKSRWCSPQSRG